MNDVYVKARDTTESSNVSAENLIFHALYDPFAPDLTLYTTLPLWTNLTQLTLSWGASDPPNGGVAGSGVKDYMVEQQLNGGSWTMLVASTQANTYPGHVQSPPSPRPQRRPPAQRAPAQWPRGHPGEGKQWGKTGPNRDFAHALNTYQITSLTNNTTYTFRITARDWAGNQTQQTRTTTIDRDPPINTFAKTLIRETTPFGLLESCLLWNIGQFVRTDTGDYSFRVTRTEPFPQVSN